VAFQRRVQRLGLFDARIVRFVASGAQMFQEQQRVVLGVFDNQDSKRSHLFVGAVIE